MKKQKSHMKSASHVVVEYIRKTVYENKLMPGDALPTENETATLLEISRASVREGYRKLQVVGFIKSRKKAGACVALANPEDVLAEVIPSLAHTETQLAELDEFRAAIECGAIALTAMRRTAEDLRDMVATLKRGDMALTKNDFKGFSQADMEFHLHILRVSGNPLLEAMGKIIGKRMSYLGDPARGSAIGDIEEEYHRCHYAHWEILSAIERQDAATASILMRFHVFFAMEQQGLAKLDASSRKTARRIPVLDDLPTVTKNNR